MEEGWGGTEYGAVVMMMFGEPCCPLQEAPGTTEEPQTPSVSYCGGLLTVSMSCTLLHAAVHPRASVYLCFEKDNFLCYFDYTRKWHK